MCYWDWEVPEKELDKPSKKITKEQKEYKELEFDLNEKPKTYDWE